MHALDQDGHRRLARTLVDATYPWLLTYDDLEDVWGGLYADRRCARFSIAHTAGTQHVGTETIVYGPTLHLPATMEVTPGTQASWITRTA